MYDDKMYFREYLREKEMGYYIPWNVDEPVWVRNNNGVFEKVT